MRKAWWKSWTIWINLFSLVLIAVEANWSVLRELMHPTLYSLGAFLIPILNVLLRFRTSMGVGKRDAECWR